MNQVAYDQGFLRLVDIIDGDYNRNGVVDLEDYTVWRNTLGSTTNLNADGNGNSIVDSGDHGVWQANFGQSLGSGALADGAEAVPEPGSIVLMTVALFGVLCRNKHQRMRPNSHPSSKPASVDFAIGSNGAAGGAPG